MAKIMILDVKKRIVGSVEFIFSKESSSEDYVFLDINGKSAAKFKLQKSTVIDATGKAIASLVCGSNGRVASSNVVPVSKYYPSLGVIIGSKVRSGLGEVIQNSVMSEIKGVVGELSINWSSEDEAYFKQQIQDYAKFTNEPISYAETILERKRSDLYQTMKNIAGCAALIMKLFEEKLI